MEISPGPGLDSLSFSEDRRMNERLKKYYSAVLNFNLIHELPGELNAGAFKLLRQSFMIGEWSDMLRFWCHILLGRELYRKMSARFKASPPEGRT